MGIQITQPFSFESTLPNFERDSIDSSTLFSSQNPLVITSSEGEELAEKYDIGHIIWDKSTKKHYVLLSNVFDGNTYYYLSLPTVENSSIELNSVVEETLILEHEIEIDLNVKKMFYIPISSKPSDWETNWENYYKYNSSTKNFYKNDSSVYDSATIYYIKTFV